MRKTEQRYSSLNIELFSYKNDSSILELFDILCACVEHKVGNAGPYMMSRRTLTAYICLRLMLEA